ncbi:hypothetical protein HDK77DRAFT_60174 [Phyllosticta capitalensis]
MVEKDVCFFCVLCSALSSALCSHVTSYTQLQIFHDGSSLDHHPITCHALSTHLVIHLNSSSLLFFPLFLPPITPLHPSPQPPIHPSTPPPSLTHSLNPSCVQNTTCQKRLKTIPSDPPLPPKPVSLSIHGCFVQMPGLQADVLHPGSRHQPPPVLLAKEPN